MLSAKKAQRAIQWTKIVVLGDGAVGKSGKGADRASYARCCVASKRRVLASSFAY